MKARKFLAGFKGEFACGNDKILTRATEDERLCLEKRTRIENTSL